MFAEANGFVARACLLAVGSLIFVSSSSAATPALQIVGTPPTEAQVSQWYFFSPGASMLGPGVMRYSIQNKPRWAAFNTTWGRLDGVPQAADVGTYDGIRISVSNGVEAVSLPAFAIRVRAGDALHSVTLRWTPTLLNEDGSALTDLAGYRIYGGTSEHELRLLVTVSTGLVRYVVEALETGTHFFAVSELNRAGVESKLSIPTCVTLD
jgi:hypothetical protein